MAKQLEIKITGGGTKAHILSALRQVIRSIEDSDTDKLINKKGKAEFEDPTLMTVLTTDEQTDEQ